jgi:Sec-independent protein translocase protein TatA
LRGKKGKTETIFTIKRKAELDKGKKRSAWHFSLKPPVRSKGHFLSLGRLRLPLIPSSLRPLLKEEKDELELEEDEERREDEDEEEEEQEEQEQEEEEQEEEEEEYKEEEEKAEAVKQLPNKLWLN